MLMSYLTIYYLLQITGYRFVASLAPVAYFMEHLLAAGWAEYLLAAGRAGHLLAAGRAEHLLAAGLV